jgi:hypothetical protein
MSSVKTSAPLQLHPPARRRSPGQTVVKWVTTTDHKVIGNLYFFTSFGFFMIGGLLALLIRAELFAPGLQIVDNPEQYNQLFTMHGNAVVRRIRQCAHADPDRRAGRGIPAAEHARLLAVSVRRPDRLGGLPHAVRCSILRVVRLRPALGCGVQPRHGR